MYYNRILRVWSLDPFDYFLISAIIASILASSLKNYLSEKKAMERLKNSIIQESKIVPDRPVLLSSKEAKIKNIYRFALGFKGGQLEEDWIADYEFSNNVLNLAQKIKGLVKLLAVFLKERELKGVAKIFFKNGRLLLELILYKCKIDITYSLLNTGVSTQVIIITSTLGGATGFSIAWFSAGAALVTPPLLILTLLIRSVLQQIANQNDYSKFKNLMNKMLDDEKLKETLRAVFDDVARPSVTPMQMKPFDPEKNYGPKFNFKSDQNLEEFIKAKMEEELGLVENATYEQIEEMISNKIKLKPRAKTVFFKDIIDKRADFLDSDIIDAEIIKNPIKVKVRNEEL